MGGEREPKINYAHCSFDPKGERGEVFSTLVRLLHLIDLEELGGEREAGNSSGRYKCAERGKEGLLDEGLLFFFWGGGRCYLNHQRWCAKWKLS